MAAVERVDVKRSLPIAVTHSPDFDHILHHPDEPALITAAQPIPDRPREVPLDPTQRQAVAQEFSDNLQSFCPPNGDIFIAGTFTIPNPRRRVKGEPKRIPVAGLAMYVLDSDSPVKLVGNLATPELNVRTERQSGTGEFHVFAASKGGPQFEDSDKAASVLKSAFEDITSRPGVKFVVDRRIEMHEGRTH